MPYDNEKDLRNIKEDEKHGGKTRAPWFAGNGGVILLRIIVIGVLAAIIAGVIDERISIAIVGIVVFISGCAAIATIRITRETFVIVFLPIVGFVMAVIPTYLMLSEHYPATFPSVNDEVRKTFLGALVVLIGLCMTVIALAVRVRLRRCCTCEVDAVCIYIDERRSRGIKSYAPQWEYYVNGQTYTHQEMASSLRRKTEVGHRQTIMVNPDNPGEIYRCESKEYLLFVAMGICLVFVGGIILGWY